MNKILITLAFAFISVFILMTPLANADRFVNVTFLNGTIDDSGNLTQGTTPVTNVNAIGLVCTSADCNTVGSQIFSGATLNSGATNSLMLTFPTDPQYAGGLFYGIYLWSTGYVPWEQTATFYGTCTTGAEAGCTSADPQGPYTFYLSKKQNCYAPILDLTVANDVNVNQPLVIGVNASLDSSAYSPIQASGTLNYTPSQISEYNVTVNVTTVVRDSLGTTVATFGPTALSIPYSQSKRVEYTWTPATAGTYTIESSAVADDAKCLASQTQTTSKQTTVLATGPTNMCYALLQNLSYSNPYPQASSPLTISLQKISNYANAVGTLTAVPTSMSITVVAPDGSTAYSNTTTWLANADTTSYQNVNWVFTPSASGSYNASVVGQANDALCSGLTNNQETMSVGLFVAPLIPPAPPTPPAPPAPSSGGCCGGGGGGYYVAPAAVKNPSFTSVNIPSELAPGEKLNVSGYVENAPTNSSVELYVDGTKIMEASVKADGYFEIFDGSLDVGLHTVKVMLKGTSLEYSKDVTVHTTVSIKSLEIPSELIAGKEAQIKVALNVGWPTNVELSLVVDGQVIETKTAYVVSSDTVSLSWTPDSAGAKELKVTAKVFGSSDSKTQSVTVKEAAKKAEFPWIPLAAVLIVIAGVAAYIKREPLKAALKPLLAKIKALVGALVAKIKTRGVEKTSE